MTFELSWRYGMLWSMNKSTDLRRGRTCVFLMHVHLVFVTKYRQKVFTKKILEDLRTIFLSVCNDFEAHLVEFEGGGDHVHLLINYPPKVAISKLVLVRRKTYPSIQRALWGGSLWSPSYFAGSCGGAPIELIRQYIEQQQSPQI